ncbi:RluA family pseudouridine synthase [uncultured Veillonella sp.]|jgi:23S rRNA pseudouridine1911/1915/1917 synthase|uniref:RluA family pseudouridine synthase n=1 Tax=uncultured Veillonella sp. TaxID=159268 RepID=UPI0026004E01|nr:RluA family pseudouridine synthase [uncultured Veillonella sp.]
MARKTHRPDDILWTVTAADIETAHSEKQDITLGAVLDTKYPRKSLVKLFEEKLIHINGHKAMPKDVISEGDEIWIAMAKEKIDYEPIEMDLHILYEDDDLLIVDKPVGVTVNSKDQVSLANGVAYYFKENGIKRKVRFLNRLDRDTTGCIVIAKSGLAQSLYQQQMDDNTFEKWYMATVEGLVDMDEDSLVLPMDRSIDGIHYEVNPKGKETRTDYSVLCRHSSQPVDNSVNKSQNSVDMNPENVDIELQNVDKHGVNVDKSVHNSSKCGYTEVLVRLYTGKTHQIRVAFSHIGHPLVGDTLYGAQPTGSPFQLRAQKVVFTHMRTGERITVTA